MIWFSLTLVGTAVAGIIASQIYLRVALRPPNRQRRIERFVAACAAVATLGYGIATYNCFATPQGLAVYPLSDGVAEKFSVPSRIVSR
jgi:hypothetical protein